MSASPFYVIDSNAIFDLFFGNVLERIFLLPCKFIVTDLLKIELIHPPFHLLSKMGLLVERLNSDEIKEISDIMAKYPKPSHIDISVLVLAKSKKTILITGDEDLRHAAIAHGVDCYGTCWLIDYLTDQRLITYTEAIEAFDLIRKKPRYPPKDECRYFLSQWKSKRKLFD